VDTMGWVAWRPLKAKVAAVAHIVLDLKNWDSERKLENITWQLSFYGIRGLLIRQ